MKIVLDPGHGGDDPGAVGSFGVPEKDIALSVALQMAGLLSYDDRRCNVSLTRYEDTTLTLQQRCEAANEWADVFVSIHCNAFSVSAAHGYEVWTNPDADPADHLASLMWYRFRETFPDMRGRADFSDGDPDKESKFWVLVHTQMPAVLFELAFLTNPDDQQRLLSPSWQSRAANALVRSIFEWRST